MNGQDFNEVGSDAYITFVGTGSGGGQLKILIFILLLALLILALMFCFGQMAAAPNQPPVPYVINEGKIEARATFSTQRVLNPDNARLSS